MTAEANKLAFRRAYEEVFNQGNLAVVDEVIAEDFVNREEHPATTLPGPEAIRTAATMLRAAFPDLHFTVEDLVAEGELVAGRLTMRGTHHGPLLGIPPRVARSSRRRCTSCASGTARPSSIGRCATTRACCANWASAPSRRERDMPRPEADGGNGPLTTGPQEVAVPPSGSRQPVTRTGEDARGQHPVAWCMRDAH
jgi:predicted ester cyclase